MKAYSADSSAEALVLNEFGYAWINANRHIVFEYHVKIKILKPNGQRKGDFRIALRKFENNEEKWGSLEAVSFNLVNSSIKESQFNNKNLIFESTDRSYDYVKFALPDVRVGSVIEIKYSTESPFLFNFHTWEFQDDTPKVISAYWCEIPVKWVYNISLRGFYKLDRNEVTSKVDCYQEPGNPGRAPCILTKYAMKNIPAFKEEKYMTAPSNYISAIYFEIAEYRGFDGTKIKYSEEWKDVDAKLRQDEKFGYQIKKAKNLWDDLVKPLTEKEQNQLNKANLIFDFVKGWYTWNGSYGMYADLEVKKAYEQKRGNDADINFALIGALQAAGLEADPVLVATRDFGLPSKVHPQRSGFNYVIARLKIENQQYLLDATEAFLPFGVLPIRCLNDQGRLISKEESGWIDLKPLQKLKNAITMDLKLSDDGSLKGDLRWQHFGYRALEIRKELSKSTLEDYLGRVKKKLSGMEIDEFEILNKDSIAKPLIERMKVQIITENANADIFYFNPFIIERYANNPFKSSERFYPVDFGAPTESTYYTTVVLPENWKVDESPPSKSFSLPNGGGRFLMNITTDEKRIVLASTVSLSKPIYTAEEYNVLREFFARVVQTHQSQFVFKKMK